MKMVRITSWQINENPAKESTHRFSSTSK